MPPLKNGHIPQLLATEYASYRDDVIKELSLKLVEVEQSLQRPLVLYDPLAGTAPLLSFAERQGYTAYFNDLNSLHLYINRIKTFEYYLKFKEIGIDKLHSIVCRLTSKLDRCRRTATEHWIEDPVLEALTLAWKKSEDQPESITTLTKAILLLAVRSYSSYTRTKNPIWLKPGGLRSKITVEKAFQLIIARLDLYYKHAYAKHSIVKGGNIVLTDNDASISTPPSMVDVIMTSPPFCNRVDWNRMYAPEHFFLEAVGVRHTRTEFLGTTSVRQYSDFDSEFKFVTERSNYMRQFLNKVQERQIGKMRESNYYLKYFTRYFAGLFCLFDKTASVLSKDSAGIYFVVQDNFHRGLSIEIGKALAESLSAQGFQVQLLEGEGPWNRHHLGLQNISKRYRLVAPKQRESIWHAIQ